MEIYQARPDASALIESMRDIGYSIETALADIVDNSITAKADQIDIQFEFFGSQPCIGIIDNGIGMSRDELLNAMRPGSQNPLESRNKGDLGRFGLGLKTASFSQCRVLTVVSRKDGVTSCARWNLDFVADQNDWLLQLPDGDEIDSLPFISRLGEAGTIVLWQDLDRLSESTGRTPLKNHIEERLDYSQSHLELVFHRFLTGSRPFSKVTITINDHPLEAFDPFHTNHAATQQLPDEEIRVEDSRIKMRAYVLPHHHKVSKKDWEKLGGADGYLKGQGFYIYREGRLIIHGSWFRLARKAELTKLARVQVDMPNELDHLWKIDIKKASAVPPLIVRERLKTIIDRITGTSKKTYKQRGAQLTEPTIIPVWQKRVVNEKIYYELNRDYPSLLGLCESIDEGQKRDLELYLKTAESAFPIDALFADMGERPTDMSKSGLVKDDLIEIAKTSIEIWLTMGLSHEEIILNLRAMEPIRSSFSSIESEIYRILGT